MAFDVTGSSLTGRQVLTTYTGALTRVNVWLVGGPPAGLKRYGFISIEYANGPAPLQIRGRSLWFGGVSFTVTEDATSSTKEVVAYWRETGLSWRAQGG